MEHVFDGSTKGSRVDHKLKVVDWTIYGKQNQKSSHKEFQGKSIAVWIKLTLLFIDKRSAYLVRIHIYACFFRVTLDFVILELKQNCPLDSAFGTCVCLAPAFVWIESLISLLFM